MKQRSQLGKVIGVANSRLGLGPRTAVPNMPVSSQCHSHACLKPRAAVFEYVPADNSVVPF